MVHARSLPLALGLLVACAGCSSSKNDATVGEPEDADVQETSVEDAAPWLTYPPGPYGLAVGDTFPNLQFKGYKKGTGEWTDLAMIDYYDPDGTRGIYGIYYVVGAQWCPPCNEEADMLSKFYPEQYRDRGGVFFTAIIEDSLHKPATQKTVDQWVAKHNINFDIALDDKSDSLPKSGSVGLPYNYLINPRTMKVFKIIQGVNPAATTITPLNVMMKNNGAPALDAGTPDGG